MWGFLPCRHDKLSKATLPIFFCFGHCFLFPALIILILHVISGWQTSRLLKGGCLCLLFVIVMKPAKNHYKMLESSLTPRPHDSYFNYRSQISYVCFSYMKQHTDKLCLNVSLAISNVCQRREWLALYMVHSTMCSDQWIRIKGTIHTFLKDTLPSLFPGTLEKTRAST